MIGSTKEGLIGSKGMELAGFFAEECVTGLAVVLGEGKTEVFLVELSIVLTKSAAGGLVEWAWLAF